jgi:FKBP-type peptidyl-prolyl cis-trans isomerase 2
MVLALILAFCVGCAGATDEGLLIDDYFVPDECTWEHDGDHADPSNKESYKAKHGDTVEMYYSVRVKGGELIAKAHRETPGDLDADVDPPIIFVIGAGEVIKGWENGAKGMCAGSKRKLTIPPTLAFGDEDVEGIPAGSTIEVDMELSDILHGDDSKSSKHEEAMKLIFKAIDTNHNGRLSKVRLDFLYSRFIVTFITH